jgi:hypothetical protein
MRDVKSLHRLVFSADRAVQAAVGGAFALGLSACDPTVFDELADDTGVRVAEVPGGYARAGFGAVVATYGGRVGEVPVTRLAASAGADSQVRVYTGWTGETIALEPAAYDTCLEATDCERGAGASLTGLPRWRDQPLCVAFGAPAASTVLLRCEGVTSATIERLGGPVGSRFGASVAALPGERLLVGAPFGAGNVFVVDAARGVRTIATALEPARADGVAEYGAAVAAGALPDGSPLPDGSALAAIAAPSGALRRVAVVSLDPMGEATLAACLEDAAGPFGDVLAVGDVVGDDTPDVVVGDDPASVLRREEVRVYDGAALLAAGGACPALVEPAVIACVDHRGVACAGSGFGTSLAIGDVDGDGDGDLAVGAPEATVEGEAQAGAVWLVPGNGDALEASGADVLTASTPETAARLGASVAMLATRARSEVVAGSPGSAEVYVFGCSGLAGDGPSVGPRCIPAR